MPDEASIDPGSNKMADAHGLIAEGDALRDADPAEYEDAAKKYKKAADKVKGISS